MSEWVAVAWTVMSRKKLSGRSKMLKSFVGDWNIRLNNFWVTSTELKATEAVLTEKT